MKMVMTRKELLEIKRTELLNELFGVVDQLHSAIFETVEQMNGLAERQVFLESQISKIDERIKRLNSNS